MAEITTSEPHYLVIAHGESDEPVMEIVEGFCGVRRAVARMIFGSVDSIDWDAVDRDLKRFDDPTYWILDGVHFEIDFEVGGIEITRLSGVHTDVVVECCNGDCGWKGARSECVYCGAAGPLCPECHEVTEQQ